MFSLDLIYIYIVAKPAFNGHLQSYIIYASATITRINVVFVRKLLAHLSRMKL